MARLQKNANAIAAVDLGASKAACLIALMDPARPDAPPKIIGAACRPVSSARAGLALSEVEASIRAAVGAAEEKAGVMVRKALLAISGRRVRSRRLIVETALAGRVATLEDLAATRAAGAEAAAPDDFEVLHALPIAFSVDGDGGWMDPCGLSGDVLELDMLGVSARASAVRHLETAVEAAHLEVCGVAAAPYASALATTISEERDLGCLVLDMGASETGFAAFERGRLVACGAAPLGGEHVTRDIARVFGVAAADAERLKVVHGSCIADARDMETARARALGDGGELEIDQGALRAVIAPRVEETFEQVRLRAAEAGVDARVIRHIVLTGGASALTGSREVAERVFGRGARLGKPIFADGAPASASGPAYAAVYGTLQAGLAEDTPEAEEEPRFSIPAPSWARRLMARL